MSTLPVGAIVKSVNTRYNGAVIRFVVGHQKSDRVCLVTERIISLKCFDAKEPSNPNSDRKNYGNNRYSQSNIDQWLTSAAASWYSARHSYDAPPNNANVWSNYNEYDTEPGFLYGFEAAFRNALLNDTITIAKNTVTDGGGSESITRKVRLLTETEVGLGNENGVAEGTVWSYFNSAARRQAYPTAEAVSKSEYTTSSLSATQYWYYWLATPYAGSAYYARYVYSDGSLSSNYAYGGDYGVRPAFVVDSDICLTLEEDEVDLSDSAMLRDFTSKQLVEEVLRRIAEGQEDGDDNEEDDF